MTVLLNKIKDRYPAVAKQLEKADFRSDQDIRTLTREDLHELFRGPENLKSRKGVYELIHEQKPIDMLLKDLKAFIPAESLSAALTENGDLIGYLQMLKDLTSQVEKVLSFFQAHVNILEELRNDNKASQGVNTRAKVQPVTDSPKPASKGIISGLWNYFPLQGGKSDEGPQPSSLSEELSDTDATPDPRNPDAGQPPKALDADPVREAPPSVTTQQMSTTEKLPTVTFLSIVSGKTLDCENRLMDRLRNLDKVILVETEESNDPQLIMMFCSITTRIDADLESAMSKRPASLLNKPVFLVMMHHVHQPNEDSIQKPSSFPRKWNIVLQVNVFFHDTMHGLLSCIQNNHAVTKMHAALLKHLDCEGAGDVAKSDTCSGNSRAPELLVGAGNDDIGQECNAGTSSHGNSQSSRPSSVKGSRDNQGSCFHHVYTCPSGNNAMVGNDQQSYHFYGQQANVGEVGAHNSSQQSFGFQGNKEANAGNGPETRFIGANATGYCDFQDNQGGNVGMGGNDHKAGKKDIKRGGVSMFRNRF